MTGGDSGPSARADNGNIDTKINADIQLLKFDPKGLIGEFFMAGGVWGFALAA